MNGKQGFILGFALAMILIVGGVSALTAYYMNVQVGFEKKPSTFTRETISVFVAELAGYSAVFGKNNSTELVVSLPTLQENTTTITKECHINNMEPNNITVTFDSIINIPEGAEITIVYKMNDPWNIEGRQNYSVGTTSLIKPGETLYFWITVEDVGLSAGSHNFCLKFHTS